MKIFLHIVFILYWPSFYAQSFEIYNGDTINRIDLLNCKQGKWIVTGKMRPGSCYKENAVSETGVYINNRKTGEWIEYFCSGGMKNKLHFVNGRPDGLATIYHENGKVAETGLWKNNRWAGDYALYDSLGTELCHFTFDSKGKRIMNLSRYINDVQPGDRYHMSYFRELTERDSLPDSLNGYFGLYNKKKRIAKEGFFENNKLKNGRIYIYDSLGILRSTILYKDGFEVMTGKPLNDKKIIYRKPDSTGIKPVKVHEGAPIINPNIDKIAIEGKFKTGTESGILLEFKSEYNKKKQLIREGSFKKNKLWSGEEYFYNKEGKLVRVKKYKDGKYIGDADPAH